MSAYSTGSGFTDGAPRRRLLPRTAIECDKSTVALIESFVKGNCILPSEEVVVLCHCTHEASLLLKRSVNSWAAGLPVDVSRT
ncbi:hypothetical protein MSG28_012542 [Choristoneura fumiferana]|uniref:Uncharacterized protein n=1 Tax=Choristoneura fumiferana TaxID=7141 RepID=A0ACC0JH63_CHOFU|nr:hypothetical protein MSG28_012542 [Choristoneura fumiferana]